MDAVGSYITILPLPRSQDPVDAVKQTFFDPSVFSAVVNATSTEFSLADISARVLPPPVKSFASVSSCQDQEHAKLSQTDLAKAVYEFIKEYKGARILLLVEEELLKEKVNQFSLGLNLSVKGDLLLYKVYNQVTHSRFNEF